MSTHGRSWRQAYHQHFSHGTGATAGCAILVFLAGAAGGSCATTSSCGCAAAMVADGGPKSDDALTLKLELLPLKLGTFIGSCRPPAFQTASPSINPRGMIARSFSSN